MLMEERSRTAEGVRRRNVDQHELVRGLRSGECSAQPEECVDAVEIARHNQDRVLNGRRLYGIGDGTRFERRVVGQDLALELLEALTRLEPKLVVESTPTILVDSEGFGLAPRPVQGEHQLTSQSFS